MAWKRKSPNRITSGHQWSKIRHRILLRDPICRECINRGKVNRDSISTICDHIINLEAGGTNDDDNLQGLCKRHHDEKTDNERRKALGWRKKRAVDDEGYPIDD